ncbi:MAG: FAD binding domain-containing protein [Elusimicrobia bacterium]|nr:FAD binding domain-containing protein [Elusimicrobiota bacterium]
MKNFDYYKPKTLAELLKLKDENSAVFAGGTDLLVDIRSGKKNIEKVIDIKGIKEFYGIKKVKGGITIGACETFNSIAKSQFIRKLEALRCASSVMGCYEIRNRATIGGNISNSSPGCETGVVLVVFEAKVNIISKRGKRTVPIEKFFKGVNKTDLKPNEIVQSIFIPEIKNSLSFYRRYSRTEGMDLACCNGAFLIINPKNPLKREIRMSFGTVTPIPFRDREIERDLSRKKLTQDDIDKAYLKICERIAPREGSVRASPEEKRLAIKNFMNEVLGPPHFISPLKRGRKRGGKR